MERILKSAVGRSPTLTERLRYWRAFLGAYIRGEYVRDQTMAEAHEIYAAQEREKSDRMMQEANLEHLLQLLRPGAAFINENNTQYSDPGYVDLEIADADAGILATYYNKDGRPRLSRLVVASKELKCGCYRHQFTPRLHALIGDWHSRQKWMADHRKSSADFTHNST